jgi:hypothetical protein
MTLKLVSAAAVILGVVLAGPTAAPGQQISKNNPYRSFNISGINYGSMQWEKEHRQGTARPQATVRRPSRGLLFRRR